MMRSSLSLSMFLLASQVAVPFAFADHSDSIVVEDSVHPRTLTKRCAAAVTRHAASAVVEVASDQGVDWPDTFSISRMDDLENGIWRVVVNELAFEIRVSRRCRLVSSERMATVPGLTSFSNPALAELQSLGQAYLGQEFFGHDNIGGARVFQIDQDLETQSHEAIVVQYFKSWQGVSPEVQLVADPTPAAIRAILDEMNIVSLEPDVGEEPAVIGAKIESLINGLIADYPSRYAVVAGRWTDSGIGDPAASFIVLINQNSGKALVLEQGFVD